VNSPQNRYRFLESSQVDADLLTAAMGMPPISAIPGVRFRNHVLRIVAQHR